ncbi:Hypothetical protein NTJ_12134 [Nesidiocoris tenuis]|uniref:RRM domain-containing protein n=1 Tax=Nesidiocoris tenuis TaxID=355587 RepID=A0ABN7B6Q3_9HEMI|nr:Hypothetical protein NTJ_12134 [Nesidiocoris tenuis]
MIFSPESTHDDKDKKSNYRNLWVSGLAAITRAQDLKQIFSKLGKVVAAKVVTNAKTPGARCYGFVTMATAEDAQACIKGLNLTELHGKLISVEAVANKPASGNAKKPEEKRKASPAPAAEEKKLKREDTKTKITIDDKKVDEKSGPEESAKKKEEEAERPKTANSDRSGRKSGSPVRRSRPPIRERLGERPVVASRNRNRETRPARPTSSKRSDVLSFSHIKEEHDRRRQREKERAAREEERRRREEVARQRSIELRQKEEMMRLEREREKVRLERLKLQKEKQELLRIERERLEREKEELRKAQLKLEEEKRAKRVAREVYEERKRSDSSRRYDPVGPPPRKEVRRDASPPHARRYEESSRTRRDELPPPPRVKETLRYPEKTSSSSIRPGREDRSDRREERRERARDEPLRKESSRMHREDRYDPPPPPKPDLRYGSESWTGGKPYPSSGSRPDAPSWMSSDRKSDANPWGRSVPSQSDRWPVSGSSGMVGSSRSGMYGGSLNLAGGLSHPGSGMSLSGMSGMYPASDRYDAYKPGSMGRKY